MREYFKTHSMRPKLPMLKPDKNTTSKLYYRPVSLMNINANLIKITANQIQ